MDNFKIQIASSVKELIRSTVAAAAGREVFFVGHCDGDGILESATPVARGNEHAVPVIMAEAEKGDAVIHNHPSGNLSPSDADLEIASRLGEQGVGFLICDNLAVEWYAVTAPVAPDVVTPIDLERIIDHFLPGGKLSRVFEAYEVRDPQLEMVENVVGSFNDDGIALIEAGTGVGKSLAYLLPAAVWVLQNRERVVISTATINLQQQILDKDLPLVFRILGRKIPVVLMKGRSNYLCRRRLQKELQEIALYPEEREALEKLREWAEQTQSGSKSDMNPMPEAEIWSRVASESDSCTGIRCAYRDSCFVLKARRQAAAARILVVNHHLLFADLGVRLSGLGFDSAAVLPPFQRIIFDEAHNIEKSVSSFFSNSLSRFSLVRLLNRLYRRRRSGSSGLIPELERLLPAEDSELRSVAALINEVLDTQNRIDEELVPLLTENTVRLQDIHDEVLQSRCFPLLRDLKRKLGQIPAVLKRSIQRLDDDTAESDTVFELRMVLNRIDELVVFCDQALHFRDDPDRVFWFEKRRNRTASFLILQVNPLNISSLMREAVYDPFDSLVFTSATLTMRKSFDAWKTRLGMDDISKSVTEACLPSPFPYRERVLLAVAQDAPEPRNTGPYTAFLIDFIARLVTFSQGRALVLFTSYAMMRQVWEGTAAVFDEAGIVCYKQGDDDRARLLEKFQGNIESVLFATDSFWEGIDAPGETLKLVIICRLPFRVPSDPVLKSKMERLAEQGRDPFREISLPDAVTRFKQGFGRLMRKKSDGGCVVVTDPRLCTKSYGAVFLGSLPETQRIFSNSDAIFSSVENYLFGE